VQVKSLPYLQQHKWALEYRFIVTFVLFDSPSEQSKFDPEHTLTDEIKSSCASKFSNHQYLSAMLMIDFRSCSWLCCGDGTHMKLVFCVIRRKVALEGQSTHAWSIHALRSGQLECNECNQTRNYVTV
jgi:hypothetical protein